MALGVNRQASVLLLHGAEEGIDLRERFDLVAEELDAIGGFVVGGKDFDYVAAHPKGPAPEVVIVPLVENLDKAARDVLAGDVLAFFEQKQHAVISLGRPQTVDAAHRTDDDRVAAFEQGACRRETKLVELFVDGCFFFDVEVARGDIGLGLVVVVITDEVFHRVTGEELLELVVELGGEGFVMRQDEGWAIGFLDNLGHGEGLAGAGDAEEHLVFFSRSEAIHQFFNRAGLIAAGLV